MSSFKKLSTKEKNSNKNKIFIFIVMMSVASLSVFYFLNVLKTTREIGNTKSMEDEKSITNEKIVSQKQNTFSDVNKRDSEGLTPIMKTLSKDEKNESTLKEVYNLLKKDVDFNVTDNDGKTILMYAAFYDDKEIINDMVKKGANINAKDKEGRTALHWASFYGKLDSVKELLALKANTNIKDKYGLTAFDLANFEDHPELEEVFKGISK